MAPFSLESGGVWSLSSARVAIIIAGCLGMAYTQLTMSPATIEFARQLGANGLHIGILGALPTGMLFLQFVAALVANHLQYRRRLWMATAIVQRLICLPIALGPFLFPEVSDAVWVWGLIAVTAANHGLLHFTNPLWLSWMGDYLPHQGLTRYWGIRHRWMQWTAGLTLLFTATWLLQSTVPIRSAFAVLIGLGAVFGVADILIFLKVEEPPVTVVAEPELRKVLLAPLRHPGFRSFIAYASFWHFAAMIGAPFISLYMLSELGMSLFQVLMVWSLSWGGGAIFSGRLGRLAEDYGNRPILIICTALKSINMIALLLVPQNDVIAFAILAPVFMLDALLNAGIAIASNGFMLKNSPAENRTMYIAAGTAIAGMVGGLTSILAGGAMMLIDTSRPVLFGRAVTGFEVLFAASLIFRLLSLGYARRIQEPHETSTIHVATLLIGATPMRMIRYPIGLYRTFFPEDDDSPIPRPLPQHEPEPVASDAK